MAITAEMRTQVSQLYVALFGRAPDTDGLGFWVQQLGAGKSLTDVANTMYATEPARVYYPSYLTNQEIISSFYVNVLGRAADAEGLAFWTAKLNASGASVGSVITEMINVVANYSGTDPDGLVSFNLFNNKVEVAQYWGENAGGVDGSSSILAGVTADDASVTAAIAQIGSGSGAFTLTNGTDNASANVFNAGLVYTPGGDDRINALQDEDILTGTGDNPTLNATLGNANDNGATVVTPKLQGIETVNVAFTGSGGTAVVALDLQDTTGLNVANITRVSQAVNRAELGNIQNALESMSVSNSNANQAGVVEFSYANGALLGDNTATLTLDNVNVLALNIGRNTSGIAANGVGLEGYEHLTIDVTSDTTIGTLNLPMDTGSAGTVTLTGEGNVQLGGSNNMVNTGNNALLEAVNVYTVGTGIAQAGGRISSIDASALTGNLTIVLDNILDVGKAETSGVLQDVTVTGGAGDDTFVLYDVVQAGDKIIGGEGTDTLLFYSGSGLNSVAESIEVAALLGDGSIGNIAVDFSNLASVTDIQLRNISSDVDVANFGGDGVLEDAADAPVTFTLTKLNAAQAAGITLSHSTTGNGDIADNVIQAALATNTASDTLGVKIAEGLNVDPRFNFTIDTAFATSGTSTFENLTITDSDSESNSVELEDFTQFTGTVTLTGGRAGTFLNFDVDTAGADVTNVTTGVTVDGGQVQQGLLGLATDGTAVDFAAGNIFDVAALATQVRLRAATIDASAEASNVIVRVSTNVNDVNGAQKILMGSGNDTVIFDLLNDARAGLTISDTVSGGTGSDTLVIDGNATRVSLGASEWTNVTGFETIRLVGNGAAALGTTIGQNSYNLALTNDLITANGSGMITIINDNDISNDAANGVDTATTGVESAVTIDARTLDAQHHFTYNGEEGVWVDADLSGNLSAGDTQLGSTVDKFIFGDANVNGMNVIDGGALDNSALTWNGNTDVFEVRNTATVTTGDLANVKNVGIIAGSNDQATVQKLTLQLNDTVVDNMVDSYHTSSTTQQEVLTVRMNDGADVTPVALATLDLDASQLTARSVVNVTLDTAGALDSIKLGMGVVAVTTFDSGAGATADNVVLSASQFGLIPALVGTTVTANGGNVIFGALGSGAITDRIYVVEGGDLGYGAGATNDVGIYYDADGSGAGAAILIGVLVDTGAATLSGGSGLDIVA